MAHDAKHRKRRKGGAAKMILIVLLILVLAAGGCLLAIRKEINGSASAGEPVSVSIQQGYGIYFRREDTLYFVELMAEDDRSAEVLMEAAREKEVIVERAVITVGAAQNLFLGEGTRQDYGMIRFDAEPFDVEESYMRLMMES